ncbi:Wadjet anti-phage system protein JetD domain-containing protein [Romboutsia sp.]|uniref:Wadjet anti-phage system protein JetD domain-containing protein n=1 Tax=Romboutsia sp. TaxID=1965302 RepID=UPI003F302C49
MKDIGKLLQNKIDIQELQKYLKLENYNELYEEVLKLIKNEKIKPIKASGLNGKTPALYNRYTISKNEKVKDYTEELSYKINTKLDISKYVRNPKLYEINRENILMLSQFLDTNIEKLNTKVSINERSFQIFAREKFLAKEGGKTLIKSLGLDEEFLNIYDTTEPLAYYSKDKSTPQNILIIENKDTFYSMRNFIINNKSIFNAEISTIIYGGGKSIYKSFKDFEFCVEPYLTNEKNKLLYLGDLDYEGILIYESLSKIFSEKFNIEPFIKGYDAMIRKYKSMNLKLPMCSINQNKNIESIFFDYFDENTKKIMEYILESGKYIPQEILNVEDF